MSDNLFLLIDNLDGRSQWQYTIINTGFPSANNYV
jgi:hypothetical protein